MAASKRTAVILAGGSGTRFWPLSRGDCPKQYLKLFGKRSLIQHTWDRLAKICKPKDILVCTSVSQKKQLSRQLPKTKTILEPAACNTGPAILLSALDLLKQGYDRSAVMGVFPADHYITNTTAFERIVNQAFEVAEITGGLVTLGILPRSAHTGYGYIEAGSAGGKAHKVSRFVEKPDAARAQEFVRSGKFYWNGGIFVWTIGAILDAFQKHAFEDFQILSTAKSNPAIAKAYRLITQMPVDKMIMEKASNVYMVPADMGWSDVGSWNALYELKTKDGASNVIDAKRSTAIQSSGCLVLAPGLTVATIGVKDLIIVAEGDTLLVCAQSADQDVREAAKQLDI